MPPSVQPFQKLEAQHSLDFSLVVRSLASLALSTSLAQRSLDRSLLWRGYCDVYYVHDSKTGSEIFARGTYMRIVMMIGSQSYDNWGKHERAPPVELNVPSVYIAVSSLR